MARQTRKQKVEGWVEELRPLLFLQQWNIDVCIERNKPEIEQMSYMLAQTDALPQYFSACITIYPPFWDKTFDDTFRKRTILHELLHCVTEESKMLAADEDIPSDRQVVETNERLTEWLTNVVWKLL